jgi:hypothetical protein
VLATRFRSSWGAPVLPGAGRWAGREAPRAVAGPAAISRLEPALIAMAEEAAGIPAS